MDTKEYLVRSKTTQKVIGTGHWQQKKFIFLPVTNPNMVRNRDEHLVHKHVDFYVMGGETSESLFDDINLLSLEELVFLKQRLMTREMTNDRRDIILKHIEQQIVQYQGDK
jgi:hypothetical protein